MRPALLAALALLPAAALAQPGDKTFIDVKVRAFGTADPFVDHLSFIRPDLTPVEVEVGLFYYREAGVALSTVVHSIVGAPFSAGLGDAVQILDDNPTSTLHPDGRVGNFNFGGQFQVVYHTGTAGVDPNRFRIANNGNAADLAAGGVSVKQNTPVALGTNIDASDGAFGFHFKLTMACNPGGTSRTMTIDAPRDRIHTYSVYKDFISATILPMTFTILDSDVATVTVVAPASATPALLLGAAALACRRRCAAR